VDKGAVKSALTRLGGRASVIDTCPVCGRAITEAHERVLAWPGKFAHAGCASYVRRANRRRRGADVGSDRRAA
jgi:adenine-specific DNA methylase